jgi:hypothetical protein
VQPAPALSTLLRTKLAPELVALVERPETSSAAVVDGRVTVRVILRERGRAVLSRLEAAGLRIEHAEEGAVVGSITVTKLATLAGLAIVDRVSLEPDAAASHEN